MYNKKYEIDEVEDFLNEFLSKPKKKKEIIVDEEIKDRLNPLTEVEYENLKQSLIKEGCRDSLILWGDILIDGHNRYEICKAFDVEYTTIKKHFNTKKDVLKWIDTNQLSRRNLTDEQRTILYGRISKINKQLDVEKISTSNSQKKSAKELGVSVKTLYNAEKYVDAIENIKHVIGKETTDDILSGKINISKEATIKLSKLEDDKKIEVINKIQSGEKYNSVVKQEKQIEPFTERINDLSKKFEIIKKYLTEENIEYVEEQLDNIIKVLN